MKTFLISLIFLGSFNLWAQPANNDCSHAVQLNLQPLTAPVYTHANLGGATETTPACSGNTSTDIWFSFTAQSTGNSIFLPSQSGLDLAFEILDACGGNSIACVDNNSTNVSESYYNNNFIVGHTYYIKVFLYNQSFSNAPIDIAVMDVPAPANDTCGNAINLPLQTLSNMTYTTVNLGGATESTPACSGSISTDVWFTFTAQSVANYIYMPPHNNLDLAFEILDACNGNSIACVNRNARNYSEAYYSNNFRVGQTYVIKVFLVDQKMVSANIEIAVTNIPQPNNDACIDAVSLQVQNDDTQRTTAQLGGATESLPACSGSLAYDVWFSFVATAPELSVLVGAHAGLDSVFELYDACNGNSLACVDDNGVNFSESLTYSTFVPGQTYYVRVFGKNVLLYNKTFDIVVFNPNPGQIQDYILQAWQIMPNPVQNTLKIQTDKDWPKLTILITDIFGKTIYKKPFSTIIEVGDFPSGVYFIHLSNDQIILGTKKLIIQHL